MGSTLILDPFEQTFGMPPASYVSDTAVVNSMPVMEITPCTPHFESGLTLFRVNEAWDKYNGILNNLGFSLSTQPIRLAFIADNFPTDTFSNEYGETFLQKFTDVASQGMQQLAQMTGSNTGIEAIENIGKSFESIGGDVGGTAGDIIGAGGTGAIKMAQTLNKLKGNLASQSGFMKGSLNTVDKMLAGHRVDFPQVWRNSGYTPSYTATIRLYNPNPGSQSSTNRHIIGPLAVILCLAIPRSDDGKTFNWPFFHRIKSKGIYSLDPSVITNITVVKGGDQQQISFNQKLAMVDVRLDFTSLYGTMLLEEKKSMSPHRPTVRNYLESLKDNDSTVSYTRNEMRSAAANSANVTQQPGSVFISSKSVTSSGALARESLLAKNEAARRRKSSTISEVPAGDRVSLTTAARQALLQSQSNFTA
jgi:hypothetical protein